MEDQLKNVNEKLDALMTPREELNDEGWSKFNDCNINNNINKGINKFIYLFFIFLKEFSFMSHLLP